MATTALSRFSGVFSDQVYSAKELNRHSGKVLDQARSKPITISRNGEQFALFKREQAADLIKTVLQFGPTLELVGAVLDVVEGKEPPATLQWLKVMPVDEIRKMMREVISTSVVALCKTGDWDEVEAVIHEWQESAIAASSSALEEALKSPSERIPILEPKLDAEEIEGAR